MPEPEDPVAEARRLLAERTPGDWSVHSDPSVHQAMLGLVEVVTSEAAGLTWPVIATWCREGDAVLIAAAPRLLQALLDRLAETERQLGVLRRRVAAHRADAKEAREQLNNPWGDH